MPPKPPPPADPKNNPPLLPKEACDKDGKIKPPKKKEGKVEGANAAEIQALEDKAKAAVRPEPHKLFEAQLRVRAIRANYLNKDGADPKPRARVGRVLSDKPKARFLPPERPPKRPIAAVYYGFPPLPRVHYRPPPPQPVYFAPARPTHDSAQTKILHALSSLEAGFSPDDAEYAAVSRGARNPHVPCAQGDRRRLLRCSAVRPPVHDVARCRL